MTSVRLRGGSVALNSCLGPTKQSLTVTAQNESGAPPPALQQWQIKLKGKRYYREHVYIQQSLVEIELAKLETMRASKEKEKRRICALTQSHQRISGNSVLNVKTWHSAFCQNSRLV